MTLREFRIVLRYVGTKHGQPTKLAYSMMTAEQQALLDARWRVRARNKKKRSPSFWSRVYIEQCWRIMWPGAKRR